MERIAKLYFDTSFVKLPQVTTQVFEELSDSFAPPKEGDFQLFQFRLLSADVIIGAGGWNCSLFPAQVLKEAVPLFNNVPVVYNHSLDVKDVVGNVVAPFYQNPYVTPEGVTMPGGVNGLYKISKKRHPSLIYDLMSEPSPIQSTSSMIEFEWEPSHDFENDEQAFYWHVGDKINGEYVHMRATKILSVTHQGLVYEGADMYAKKLDQEVKERFVSFAKESGLLKEEVASALVDRFVKQATSVVFSKKENHEVEALQKRNKELEALVGKLQKAKEVSSVTLASEREKNEVLAKELNVMEAKVKGLSQSLQDLQASYQKLLEDAEFAKRIKEEKITYAKQVYTKFAKGNPDERVLRVIERTDYADLDALIASFGGSLMSAYSTPKCAKCGNEGFVFRNSVIDRDVDELFDKEEYDIHNIIKSKL